MFRLAFAVAGFAVLLVGIVLIPLPGPGLLVIAAGLFMLALEFAWAERLLHRTGVRLEQVTGAAVKSPLRKALTGAAVVAGAVAAVAVAAFWDVPLLPV